MEKAVIECILDEVLVQNAMILTLYQALAGAGVISRDVLALYLRSTLEAYPMTDAAKDRFRSFAEVVEGDLKPCFTVIPGDKES